MSLKRALFVDDEPLILSALKRTLRLDPSKWELAFAAGGEEALEEMARGPVDVVVTDMRMPGMNGIELLERVKGLYPGTARLVLSGHADLDSVMKVLPVAQQFLVKPFEIGTLRSVLARICDLHRLLTDPALRRVVGAISHLSSSGSTYTEVTRLAASTTAGAKEIARVMARDPAMSAKVLQLVNSAFFGVPQRVVSVDQAVVSLGVGTIRSLALSVQVFGALQRHPQAGQLVEAFQERSLRVARLARRLCADPTRADEAFSGGLLHNVGEIILALELPQEATQVRALIEQGSSRVDAELKVLAVTHAEVGAYLLGAWGLPLSLVDIAGFHHRPSAITEGSLETIAAVHVGDALVDSGEPAAALDMEFLQRAGLVDRLPGWRKVAEELSATTGEEG